MNNNEGTKRLGFKKLIQDRYIHFDVWITIAAPFLLSAAHQYWLAIAALLFLMLNYFHAKKFSVCKKHVKNFTVMIIAFNLLGITFVTLCYFFSDYIACFIFALLGSIPYLHKKDREIRKAIVEKFSED